MDVKTKPRAITETYRRLPERSALRITVLYTLIGGLWIFFSDRIAAALSPNQDVFMLFSIYKGWGYILVTGLLLYWLIRRDTEALRES